MNLMGKILTLLIMIMSVVFLVIAIMVGNTHIDWKKIANDNRQKAERAQKLLNESKNAQTEKDRLLKAEAVSRQQQLAQLYSQLQIETASRDAKEKELLNQQLIGIEALENLKRAELRLAQQDQEVENLKLTNKRLIDDVATKRKEVVELTNQINDLTIKIEGLEVDSRGLNERIAKMSRVMNAIGATENDLIASIEPKIEGVVTLVKDDLVTISLGSDDGLRRGHTFDIYRQDRFVGKATVIRADENLAVARITPEFQQAVVLKGDYVTTKF